MAASKKILPHKHEFVDCGYDEQQCDQACRATHVCETCGKTRSQIAKQTGDVLFQVKDSTLTIIGMLNKVIETTNLTDAVEIIQDCSEQLDQIARQQLVELAVWEEKREVLR